MSDPTQSQAASRRLFMKTAAVGALGLAAGACKPADESDSSTLADAVGAGSEPAPDSAVTGADISSAEKLFDVRYSDAEREQLLEGLDGWINRMTRLRQVEKPNELAPAMVFDPRLPVQTYADPTRGRAFGDFTPSSPIPETDTDIAFASLTTQAHMLRAGLLTSRRLTEIYLDRIERLAPQLECFVTVTADIARAQADEADAELARGEDRGLLHGLPYGMKDIIDVANVPATWGATPYRDRIAQTDASATRHLRDAGAVLLGKTTNGALAYGDRWFDGITRNPWNTQEGSSGSSAGSASATSAGLVSFAIGTETLGSIVSPSNRCGTTGLRPTFGRVSRTGAMALCWSLDKIGPICRHVDDTGWVLNALLGSDSGDPSSLDHGLDDGRSVELNTLRVGYRPEWFESGSDADRATLEAARAAGVELVEIELPDLPYDALITNLEAEAAAAFEHLTLSNEDDTLVWQDPAAWPNTFRRARFISAVDMINADRMRRQVMQVMHDVFSDVDLIIGPNFANALLVITNFTGHPQLAIKSGFNELPTRSIFGDAVGETEQTHRVPQTTSLWAPLFEEGRLLALGRDIERRLNVTGERPPGFA